MLLAAGANVELKSDWENGSFTVLDRTDERTARYLPSNGATLTPNVAARLREIQGGRPDWNESQSTPAPATRSAHG